jgi:tetratricopeptide (TPR) repeat protein
MWLAQSPRIPEQKEPLSVLVADFENGTGDPVFNDAVEQALGIALEEASFVTTYPRADAASVAEKLEPESSLDFRMARLVARREGVKVLVAGSIGLKGSGYEISVRAFEPGLDPERGRPLATAKATAPSKAEVLQAIGRLASDIRRALGDKTPESVRLANAETFTTSSIAAMNAYAQAQALNFEGKTEEALAAYREAVRLDPTFGRAFAGMGSLYGALAQYEEAEANYQEALKHLDRMTDREKYRTLGGYYITVARNYEKAIENYETLVRLYPADNTGHANLALASLYVGDVQRAVTEGRRAIEIYPGNVLQRTNYAAYCMYAGDFAAAIAESEKALEATPDYEFALFTLALSHIDSGSVDAA